MLELCLTKWWASLGTVQISYSVSFRGITCSNGHALSMHAGEGVMRVDLSSNLGNEDISPVVTLKHQVQSYRCFKIRFQILLILMAFCFAQTDWIQNCAAWMSRCHPARSPNLRASIELQLQRCKGHWCHPKLVRNHLRKCVLSFNLCLFHLNL